MENKLPADVQSEYEFYKAQYEALKQKEDKAQHPGIGWVKASERLPGAHAAVFVRIEGKTKSIAAHSPFHEDFFVDDAGDFHPVDQVEWLDESATPAAGREEDDWVDVNDRLPEEGGRYWCYVESLIDLGFSYFQWNCDYNPQLRRFSDMTLTKGEQITHWRNLPTPPKHP